jgi:hypothetical protein
MMSADSQLINSEKLHSFHEERRIGVEIRLVGSLVLVAGLAQRTGHFIYESFPRS